MTDTTFDPNPIYCRSCRKQIPHDVEFCPACGDSQQIPPIQSHPTSPPNVHPQPSVLGSDDRSIRFAVFVLGVVFSFIAAAVGLLIYAFATSERARIVGKRLAHSGAIWGMVLIGMSLAFYAIWFLAAIARFIRHGY